MFQSENSDEKAILNNAIDRDREAKTRYLAYDLFA
jgi:hypothetical protein